MEILIIGDGKLGNAIARQATHFGHSVFQTSRKQPELIQFDMKDEQRFSNLPETDWAVISAGISGYKECEESPEARIINVERTIELCRHLLERGTRILFPSSTAVFDGKTPCAKTSTPTSPTTEYGHQKAEVEDFLRQFPEQAAILRLTKLMDHETPLITGWLKTLAANEEITLFNDLTIAPILFDDAALACCRIMENAGSGIFHCSGPKEISYLEFGRLFCEKTGFSSCFIKTASCKGLLDYCPEYCALDSAATEEFIQFKFPASEQLIETLIQPRCLLCGNADLHKFEQFKNFPGITSDCKPWPRSGNFMLCNKCGHAQKERSAQWFKDINEIYSGYEMYPLSAGSEPRIFDAQGKSTPRNGVLLDSLVPALALPEKGYMLDVGCGNGSLLQQFNLRRPKWKLYGHEQSDQREEILHHPGVQGFYSGDLNSIERKFDLITMTHVIEHLIDPVGILKQLTGLLSEDGQIVVHTSSFESSPFDLMVCDHCSHFTPETLEYLAVQAGLQITVRTDPWLAKEIGFAARKGASELPPTDVSKPLQSLHADLVWLKQLAAKAKQSCSEQETGIFGTAVAGTWLAENLNEVSFFVDEDPSKHGRFHMDIPVIGLTDVPQTAKVIMAFNKELSTRIAQRLNNNYPELNLIIPD